MIKRNKVMGKKMNEKYKNIIFDYDGTLVMGSTDEFFKVFFREVIAKYVKWFLSDPAPFKDAFLKSIDAMANNSSDETNETVFYNSMSNLTGIEVAKLKDFFVDFYDNEFKYTHEAYDPIPVMSEVLDYLHGRGYNLVLATDPMFPRNALDFKLSDCGINPRYFSLITSNQNCNRTKVSQDFYNMVLNKINIRPEETLMVGNHIDKDGNATLSGIDTILLTDYLVNYDNKKFKNLMSMEEFSKYIKENF